MVADPERSGDGSVGMQACGSQQQLTPGRSHLELRWTPLDKVLDLPWIPADLPIVQAAIEQYSSAATC